MESSNELSIAALERIDKKCCEFEKELKQGTARPLDSYLNRANGHERTALLQELLVIDIDYRRRRGENVLLVDYTAMFPGDEGTIEQAFVNSREETQTNRETATQLERIIANYVSDETSIQQREALLDLHPHLADELRDFFRHRDRMENLVDPLQSATDKQLNIRCPNCRDAVELGDDAQLSDIVCPSCGSTFGFAEPDSVVPRGLERIGQFQLIKQVGVGQFGTVWKAKDLALERTVALKIPRSRRMSATEVESFLRDARVAAQLRHPNIASVHEVGKHDDVIYIVSDLIQGTTLGVWAKKRQLTFQDVVKLCAKVAKAVHYAHEQGVVHRDLKPGNIMMDLAGDPHIVDFGLAKRDVGELTMTMEGQILGTPAYMSPEQARGEGHEADRSADIYSLGVVFFELLTGERPFRGNPQMLLAQIVADPPPRPRKFDGKIPRDLETICLKCLEKDPSNRYSSAAEFADDCQRFLDGKPVSVRPVGRVVHTVRWCRRNPAIATLLAAVATLLFAVALASFIGYSKTKSALDKVEQNLYYSEMIRGGQAADTPEGLSEVHRLVQNWQSRDVDRRGWEWRYLDSLLHEDLMTLTGHQQSPLTIAWSNNGERLASGNEAGELKIWSKQGNLLQDFTEGGTVVKGFAWSHCDTRLAVFADDGTVSVCDVTQGKRLATLKGNDPVSNIAWGHSDNDLLTTHIVRDPKDRLDSLTEIQWDLSTNDEIRRNTFSSVLTDAVRFRMHPTTKMLAKAAQVGPVSIVNLEDNSVLHESGPQQLEVYAIEWNADGSRLAFSNDDAQSVHIVDIHAGMETCQIPSKGSPAYVAWHPTKPLVAFADGNKEVQVYDVSDSDALNGFPISTLRGHLYRVTSLSFHPTEDLVATAAVDGEIKIWRLDTDAKLSVGSAVVRWHPRENRYASRRGNAIVIRSLDGTPDVVLDLSNVVNSELIEVCWSPSGSQIAALGYDHSVVLVDVATGKTQQICKSHISELGFRFPNLIAWRPDGEMMAIPEDDETIAILDLKKGTTIHRLHAECRRVFSLAWNPARPIIASGSEDGFLRIWNVETGKLISKMDCEDHISTLDWSPDGAEIACACSTTGVLIRHIDDDLRFRRKLDGHTDYAHTVSWSSDGSRIASADQSGSVRIWDAKTCNQTLVLQHPGGGVSDISWSSDGSALAATAFKGPKGIYIWNTRLPSRPSN